MRLEPDLSISGYLVLNDREAHTLHLLCSKAMAKTLELTDEEYADIDAVRSQAALILEAKRQALAAVNKVSKGALSREEKCEQQ